MCTLGRVRLPHVLYRIYDSDDHLLYVGATTNPGSRFRFHAGSQPWWVIAAKVALEHFRDIESLAGAELVAIQTENPRFNRMHTDRPTSSARSRNGETRVFQRRDGMWTGNVELPPGPDGKRRQRRVYSTVKDEALRKLTELQDAVAAGAYETNITNEGD